MLRPIEWSKYIGIEDKYNINFRTLNGKTPIGKFYITWNNAFDDEFYCVHCPAEDANRKNYHFESLAAAKEKAQEIFQELVLDCFDDKVHVIEDKERGKSIICDIISL